MFNPKKPVHINIDKNVCDKFWRIPPVCGWPKSIYCAYFPNGNICAKAHYHPPKTFAHGAEQAAMFIPKLLAKLAGEIFTKVTGVSLYKACLVFVFFGLLYLSNMAFGAFGNIFGFFF